MKNVVLVLYLAFSSVSIVAQDTHYWTHQFGATSTLLSGANATVVTDNSATINNPGGLALAKQSSISITTNAYGIDKGNFIDGAGVGYNMQSVGFNSIPLILSGIYRPKKFPKWTLGYVMVDKVRYNFNATQRFDGILNVLDDAYSVGDEEYVAQVDIKNNISEIWAGVCVSYRINEHWAIGLGNYGGYREQQFSYGHVARVIANTTGTFETVSSDFLYNISYVNVRNIVKLGLSANFDDFSAGLTVTLPGLTAYSNATLNSDLTGNNINYGTFREDFIANDRQKNLKAKYRSPFSVSLGLGKEFAKSKVYLTTEYFSGMNSYVMVEPRPNDFVRPSGFGFENSRDILLVADGRRPVMNIAVGYQAQVHEKIWILAGLRNDNTYFDETAEDKGILLAITDANLYHGSLGAMIKRPKEDLCIGVKASYGRSNTIQFENISEPIDDPLLTGETSDAVYKYMGISLIIGYVHYLN
ncbi:MAG: hypothetical protein H6551_07905 [Chitinophagales bacterium]|nr:hypothetical protein [Chitinophagaceae bacterium]MCB9065049.1 hypothetical protein [Chitinophagales bacterium]